MVDYPSRRSSGLYRHFKIGKMCELYFILHLDIVSDAGCVLKQTAHHLRPVL